MVEQILAILRTLDTDDKVVHYLVTSRDACPVDTPSKKTLDISQLDDMQAATLFVANFKRTPGTMPLGTVQCSLGHRSAES